MKQSTKYSIGITSIVLAGTLGLGTMAFAGNGDDGTGGGRRQLTTEERCERQDEAAARAATTAQERIATRVATLTERRAAAETAGETEKVARIDKALARMAKLSDRIDTRLAKLQTWAAENCD